MEKNKKTYPIKILRDEEVEDMYREAKETTKEQNEQIAAQYIAGKAVTEITESFNISHGTLYSILSRQGVQRRTGTPLTKSNLKLLTMTAEDRQDLIKRYQNGERTQDLQKRFGITKHALYSFLDQEGVQRRGRSTKRQKLSKATSFNASAVPQYLVNDTPVQIERDGDVLHINISQQSPRPITEVRVTFDKE